MAETKIKAAQFHGVVGHGTDGYFLMTNADGSMSWAEGGASGPSVTSVAYPGDDLAADPAGGQSVILTGANFGSSMSVTIGGTTAPSVAHDSSTQLTITTPAKAAGDYDIVVTNTVTGASGTFVNGISYNGVPTWTTATGSLGTFESETTISTITLAATEPDGGTITFNITNGALPSGLSLTGANIDGTTTAESSTTLYSFTIEAIDDENQATPRNFSITVNSAELVPSQNFTINTYTGNGSTQSIEGKIGTAAEFNGSSSKITLPTSIKPADSIMSISLWASNNSTARKNIFYLEYNNASAFLSLENNSYSDSTALSVLYNNAAIITPSGSALPSDGSWHHLVVTASATEVKLYKNGSQIGSTATVTVNTNALTAAHIGVRDYNNDLYWDGKIDQFRIFNRALDETNDGEVTTLYNEPSNLSTASTTDIFDDGSAIALYEFEKGANDTGGASGYIGAGGIFNGSSSKIFLTSTGTSITDYDSDFSISMWVYMVNLPHAVSQDHLWTGGGTRIIPMTINTDGTVAINFFNGGSNLLNSTTSLTLNGWTHLVMTRSKTNGLKFYLDGSESGTSSYTGNAASLSQKDSIGSYWDGTRMSFDGKIDQVRIFNRALLEDNNGVDEINELYTETSASATKSTTDIFDDGSGVALYELEGNADDTGLGAIDSGQSASFTNTNQNYIQLPSGIDTILNTKNFGLSFWVKAPNAATDAVFSTETTNSTFQIHANWGFAGAYSLINGGGSDINLGAVDSNWHHIVVTSDGSSSYKGYFDKSYKGASTYRQTSNVGTFLGSHPSGGFNLEGQIDQVRIFNRQLSQSDIDSLYNETSPSTVDYFGDGNGKALYKLDNTPDDESGSYNGTWNGTAAYSDPAEFPTYNGTETNVSYAYNGTPTNVDFVGTSFQPDLVWIKGRDTYTLDHVLTDSVRGVNKKLASNTTASEVSPSVHGAVGSFDSNGFTTIAGSSTSLEVNHSGVGYVAWCWKAGGNSNTYNVDDTGYSTASDAGLSSANGTTLNGASVNTEAGFSIINYETNINGDNRPAHGLTQEPELIIFKPYDTSSLGWYVMTKKIDGSLDFLFLNTRDAKIDTANNEFINSTHFRTSLGTSWGSVIAYCFHSVDGYQKIGSYTSNASVKITTGFEPRWIMIKYTGGTNDWWIMDTSRYDGSTGSHGGKLVKPYLEANENFSEQSVANGSVEFVSDGFYPTNFFNSNGVLYLAIA